MSLNALIGLKNYTWVETADREVSEIRNKYYLSFENLKKIDITPEAKAEFKVGDVVYDEDSRKLVIEKLIYHTVDGVGNAWYYEANELSHTRPLKEVTVEELEALGYKLK